MNQTDRTRPRNIQRGLSAAVAGAVLVVGAPLLLITLGRALIDSPNPLHGATPPWRWTTRQISHLLTRSLDDRTINATLARTGLALAWCALVTILVSLVREIRFLHAHGLPAPHVRGLGWSQAIARRLAGGLLSLSTMLPTHLGSATPLTGRSPATITTVATTTATALSPPIVGRTVTTATWSPYRVARGDSINAIASRLAAVGGRGSTRDIAQQILDRNLGRTMADGSQFTSPGLILPGWILDVPGAVGAHDLSTAPHPPSSSTEVADAHTVQRGESYWAIAEHHLEVVLDRHPSPHEVLVATVQLEDLNADALGHRSPATLLLPGDKIRFPAPAAHAPLPQPETPTAPPTPAPNGEPPSETAPTCAAPTTLPPPSSSPMSALVTPPSTVSPSTAASTQPASPTVSDKRPPATPDRPASTHTNPWAELAIASLFATGLATAVTRLRRRRLANRRPGTRLQPLPERAAITESILRTEAQSDRIAALHLLLAGLQRAAHLEGRRPLIRAVQIDPDGAELLWTQPQPQPPRPWTTTDGGWSWRASWPPSPPDSQPVPILPTLIPIGVRDGGAEVLLDLEAAGSLSVEGPIDLIHAFVSQLALALAASPLADNVDLIVIDLEIPGAAHFDRLRRATSDSAAAWLATRAQETTAALLRTKAQSTFAARLLGRPNDEWEPIVVVSTSADRVGSEQHVTSCEPGSGSVCILTGVEQANEHIVLVDSEHARWSELSLNFRPYLLTAEAANGLDELLDSVATAPAEPVSLNDSPIQMTVWEPAEDDAAAPAQSTHCYDVLVRVLGEVAVEGCAEHLTEAEVELLALLATARPDGPINIDRLATLLSRDEWRTPQLRTIQARISHLRRKLGVGSDGNPLLPDSRAATGSPSRYLLSSRVITDVDLLDDALRRALELPSSEAQRLLRGALERVSGRPYTAASGYSWAHDEHAAARAAQVIGDVAAQLVGLYGEAGDAAGIRWTVEQARRGLEDPLSEMPYRLAERRWARQLHDPFLEESVREHAVRLSDFVDETDTSSTA